MKTYIYDRTRRTAYTKLKAIHTNIHEIDKEPTLN